LHTINGGNTWNTQTGPLADDILEIDFTDRNNGWVLYRFGLANTPMEVRPGQASQIDSAMLYSLLIPFMAGLLMIPVSWVLLMAEQPGKLRNSLLYSGGYALLTV
jgi:hypothetical protein